VKSQTTNRVLALVRTMLRYAVATGHLSASPIERLSRGAYLLPVEKKRIEPPIANPADVGRLLEEIQGRYPRLHALYATAVYCGLRKGELCGLHWEDVHLEERYIVVRRSFDGLTKSARWRTVPIPDSLAPILAAHRLADPFKGHLAFPNDAGEMFTTHARLQDPLAAALKELGLSRLRLHDLRHEYASMYLAFGGNISDLQKNLGHSSVTVTEIYVHTGEARRIQEAQRMRFEAPKAATVSHISEG
jgi:integrase